MLMHLMALLFIIPACVHYKPTRLSMLQSLSSDRASCDSDSCNTHTHFRTIGLDWIVWSLRSSISHIVAAFVGRLKLALCVLTTLFTVSHLQIERIQVLNYEKHGTIIVSSAVRNIRHWLGRRWFISFYEHFSFLYH